MNANLTTIGKAFALAHKASENDQFSPAVRKVFREIARQIWRAYSKDSVGGVNTRIHEP